MSTILEERDLKLDYDEDLGDDVAEENDGDDDEADEDEEDL